MSPPTKGTDRAALERLLDETAAFERAGAMRLALERLEDARQLAVRLQAREALPGILCRAGLLRLRLGETEVATELCEAGLAVAELTSNHTALATALNALGCVQQQSGDLATARRTFERALALVPSREEPLQAAVHQNLGLVASATGNPDDARLHWLQALTAYVGLRDDRGRAHIHNNLGIIAATAGEWEAAAQYFAEALSSARDSGDRELEGSTQMNIAALAIAEGRLAEAHHALESARVLLQDRDGLIPGEVLAGFRLLRAC